MMRRMQQKDVEQKKETAKAAIRAAADSELNQDDVSVDPEELERIRKRQVRKLTVIMVIDDDVTLPLYYPHDRLSSSQHTCISTIHATNCKYI